MLTDEIYPKFNYERIKQMSTSDLKVYLDLLEGRIRKYVIGDMFIDSKSEAYIYKTVDIKDIIYKKAFVLKELDDRLKYMIQNLNDL